ncbi:hypothetical protein LCGC14_0896200 [marine sediment metagenome]|uniref:Uncharacterized protein n=1 Tax=marine sediment metagenome TaxID=412755 RepID=A0A0F9PIM8_9ZZZZ
MKLNAFKAELNRLTDRTSDVRACAGRVLDQWRYNLEDRSFGPAYQDPETGEFTTELDLAVFIAALVERRAVVTLPDRYKGRRAATRTEGEMVVSKEGRHGQLIGLRSNKDVWSMNMLFNDANVITTADVGKPRNFMMQDLDGSWHEGLSTVSFMAATDYEKKLFANTHKVQFKHFVSPNRWASFYSRAYMLAKIAIERLSDEERHLKTERKRLRDLLNIEPTPWPKSEKVGAEKKEMFWAFNSFIDGIEFRGEYCTFADTHEGLEEATLLLKRVGDLLAKLRFHCRCTDYAFWRYGVQKSIPEPDLLGYLKGDAQHQLKQPAWAKGDWQTGYKTSPRARTFFATMERDLGLSLRWRCWQKTERVAA